jgi:aminopeptidase N
MRPRCRASFWVNSNAFNAPKIDYLLEWLGHEFTHQWFPQEVAFRTPPGLYMEEAIAEFGGWHAVGAIAGDAAAERLRRSGFEYDPIYSAAAYFKLVNAGLDRPLQDLRSTADDRNVAYNKGAFVFYMLSQTLGEEGFRKALHAVTARYAFQTIGWDRFLRAIEESSGRDLNWFYDQWFRRTGAPEFDLSWRQDNGRLVGTIVQKPPFYRATLDVEVTGSNGVIITTRVDVSAEGSTEFTLPVTFDVKNVALDPSYKILRWTPDYKATASPAPQSSGR